MKLCDLSRIAHDALFNDKSQSLCSRAYDRRAHWFWAAWVRAFGVRHCRASWLWYHRRDQP